MSVPCQPEETLGCGVLLAGELILDKLLKSLGLGGGFLLASADFLQNYLRPVLNVGV